MPDEAQSPIATGSVLREALVIFGRRWWRYILLYSITALPALAAILLLPWPWRAPAGLLTLLLYFAVSQAAVAYAVYNEPAVRGLGLSAFLRIAPRIPYLMTASLVYILLTLLGFCLLIVPGCLLMARWSVYVPALVNERNIGLGLGRSTDLTDGHRWTGFWIALTPVVLIVTDYVIDPANELASWAVVAMDVVLSVFAIVAAAVFYRRLLTSNGPEPHRDCG